MEILVTVVRGKGEHGSPILITLAHPVVKRMQCVQGQGTSRSKKFSLKIPGSQVVERLRCLWHNGLGLSDKLLFVVC